MRPMQISYKRIYTLISFAVLLGITVVLLGSCKPNKDQFSGANAYQHIEELVNFGPRIPGTQGIENAIVQLFSFCFCYIFICVDYIFLFVENYVLSRKLRGRCGRGCPM